MTLAGLIFTAPPLLSPFLNCLPHQRKFLPTEDNTEHSPAKIMPALQARLL